MTSLPIPLQPRPSWLLVPGALVVALVAGVIGAIGSPFLGAVLVVMLSAAGAYAYLGARLGGVFLGVLVFVLAGYAFFGRGFAYVGVAPLFVGEMTLGLGLGALFATGIRTRLGAMHLLILAFMGWGVLTTAPYVRSVGIDALRDAAFWFYSTFALLIWALLTRRDQFATVVRAYRFVLPVFLLALPVIWVLTSNFSPALPRFPGSPVPLITMKAGDVGVHLAGFAAFIVLGLYRGNGSGRRVPEVMLWAGWGLAFLIVTMVNRGGFLSASIGLGALAVLRPSTKLIPIALAGVVALLVLLTINPSVTINGREFSADRVTERAASIVDRDGERQGTVNWRLDWWGTIIGYTFGGEHFWTGKGFGADLAEEDGFLGAATGLRSPHNATMTALARMGVPGLGIWLALHITFGLTMFKSYLAAQLRRDRFWAPILGWLLIYWGAGIINGSFDVYWEGPQGAIWMWTVIGLGLAALEIQRREQSEEPVARRAIQPIRVDR